MYTLVIHKSSYDDIIEPSAKLIEDDEQCRIYHTFDDYLIDTAEVTGHRSDIAVNESNDSKFLTSDGFYDCTVQSKVEWNFPYELQLFCGYEENLEIYQLKLRGIIAENINLENDSTIIELFGNDVEIEINRETNTVVINPKSNFTTAYGHTVDSYIQKKFNTNCETDVLRVGFNGHQYECENDRSRKPVKVLKYE